MSEFKGTPGPLSVVEQDSWPFDIQIIDANGTVVETYRREASSTSWKCLADVRSAYGWPRNSSTSRDDVVAAMDLQMANLQLRAAAPDLLEALQDTLALLAVFDSDEGTTVKSARAAIKKALGQ